MSPDEKAKKRFAREGILELTHNVSGGIHQPT